MKKKEQERITINVSRSGMNELFKLRAIYQVLNYRLLLNDKITNETIKQLFEEIDDSNLYNL